MSHLRKHIPSKSPGFYSPRMTKPGECPYVESTFAVQVLAKKSPLSSMAPEILTTSPRRFHNWANTKKEVLSSRSPLVPCFSAPVQTELISRCYSPLYLSSHTHVSLYKGIWTRVLGPIDTSVCQGNWLIRVFSRDTSREFFIFFFDIPFSFFDSRPNDAAKHHSEKKEFYE